MGAPIPVTMHAHVQDTWLVLQVLESTRRMQIGFCVLQSLLGLRVFALLLPFLLHTGSWQCAGDAQQPLL